ncbi:unnamed protein product [Paramecium sonneborni]|uniref:Uncharacterized protein n=1 Tax=Paramecium sonneborni TaxID=65129 RepID=A0A8S1R926_9CILI|nr:unnamed protein product [Paramecium sonneborni]
MDCQMITSLKHKIFGRNDLIKQIMIFLSLSVLIVLSKASTSAIVSIPQDICICENIVSQLDCTLANRCWWDFKTSVCQQQTCGTISDQYSCAIDSQCYWNGTSCTDFSQRDCSKIPINPSVFKSCTEANIFCYNNITVPSSPICSKRPGLTQNCSLLNATECYTNSLACRWQSSTGGGGACQPISCPNLKTQDDCLYYALDTTYTKLQLCIWQNENCIPANTQQVSSYSYNDCFLNTLGTYTFSSNDVNDEGNFIGYCKSCFEFILSSLMVLGAFII